MRARLLESPTGKGRTPAASALLVDDDVLMDAGIGVGELSLDQMVAINDVFLTDTRMDHLGYLPLMLDSVLGLIEHPVRVHALPAVVACLRQHIFNWQVWPNFLELPDTRTPVAELREMRPGESVALEDGRQVDMLALGDDAAGVAYRVRSASATLVYASDMRMQQDFWHTLSEGAGVDLLVFEDRLPVTDLRPGGWSREQIAGAVAGLNGGAARLHLASDSGALEWPDVATSGKARLAQ